MFTRLPVKLEKGAKISGAVQPAVAGGTDTGVVGVGRDNDVSLDVEGELKGPPPIVVPKLSATTTEGKGVPVRKPEGFAPSLRKLGYTDEEIGKMTFEQQQEIAINKTEPARAESTAKVDAVKENAKQERLAEMQLELDEEPVSENEGSANKALSSVEETAKALEGEITFEGKRGQADSITYNGKTIRQGEDIELDNVNKFLDEGLKTKIFKTEPTPNHSS